MVKFLRASDDIKELEAALQTFSSDATPGLGDKTQFILTTLGVK